MSNVSFIQATFHEITYSSTCALGDHWDLEKDQDIDCDVTTSASRLHRLRKDMSSAFAAKITDRSLSGPQDDDASSFAGCGCEAAFVIIPPS
jgi:hypothetical protein